MDKNKDTELKVELPQTGIITPTSVETKQILSEQSSVPQMYRDVSSKPRPKSNTLTALPIKGKRNEEANTVASTNYGAKEDEKLLQTLTTIVQGNFSSSKARPQTTGEA